MSNERSSGEGTKYAILMIAGFAGAFVLFILKALPGFFAFIAGLLLLFFGYGIFRSKKSNDKLAGLVCLIAGALTILSKLPFFNAPAGWLLNVCAIALLVLGVWNAIRFVLALKNRAS